MVSNRLNKTNFKYSLSCFKFEEHSNCIKIDILKKKNTHDRKSNCIKIGIKKRKGSPQEVPSPSQTPQLSTTALPFGVPAQSAVENKMEAHNTKIRETYARQRTTRAVIAVTDAALVKYGRTVWSSSAL